MAPRPPYALLELGALRRPPAARVRYTCFDVSQNHIVFGASSGGVYVFSRSPLEFVQLIPNKEAVIVRLSISPDEKSIAFANSKGLVTVVDCSQSGSSPSNLVSKEHVGCDVTAMLWSWSSLVLYVGDDQGRISILQTKTMFNSTSQVIMNLDSRVCQIDIKHYMLVVSTLMRCYVCDTTKEQYRQIGQKLRDGEYGVCFLTKDAAENTDLNLKSSLQTLPEQQEVKKYNVMTVDDNFAVSEKLYNALIYCARPSSRLWEASVDGTVLRTHQYKQVLARPPCQVVTETSYQNENITLNTDTSDREIQSVKFSKIFSLKNCVIFAYKKDAIYFLNPDNVEHTMWCDKYKDIVDCKVHQNTVFLWLQDGSMQILSFLKAEKYLLKCYVEEKYVLCGELCALYSEYLMNSNNLSPKLHIVSGLKDKLSTLNCGEMLEQIAPILDKFSNLKSHNATQMKSGIYVVDNKYRTQATFLDDSSLKETDDVNTFLSPEAMQTLKGISLTVTDTLSTSKKKLKEKWDDLEEKMKNIGVEKHYPYDIRQPGQTAPENKEVQEIVQDDIIYKEPSQITVVEVENKLDNVRIYKELYQQYRLSIVSNGTSLCHIIDSNICDIKEIYQLFLQFENYCASIDLAPEESKYISSYLFLKYTEGSENSDDLLNSILLDPTLYQWFVDSCIAVHLRTQKFSSLACECGYPLPYSSTTQKPAFSKLIDIFIEKQWSIHTQTQCYEICKKMPFLWRKILYLRRNEDLLNILLLLLQILDENLLHSFLPQFTVDTWDKAIQLYSILYTNVCLNCRKRFENVIVKDRLSWDALGCLLIKSVGGKAAVKIMERHADLIGVGELTMRFYHTCLLVARYEKYDCMIRNQLSDTLYRAYEFDDSRNEIYKLLRSTFQGELKNTSLPLVVAVKSQYWGLSVHPIARDDQNASPQTSKSKRDHFAPTTHRVEQKNRNLNEMLEDIDDINSTTNNCSLCGLPLMNEVLIRDGGLWVFRCGHRFHGACLDLLKVKLCPSCTPKVSEAVLSHPKEVIV